MLPALSKGTFGEAKILRMEKCLYMFWISVTLVTISNASSRCTFRRKIANCRGEYLTFIPLASLYDKKFQRLDMGSNNLTSLCHVRLTDLQYRNDIEEMLVDNNQISELSHKFFDDLPNLKLLDLSYNNIKRIEHELYGMVYLAELIISYNPIDYLSEDSFRCSTNLINVNLRSVPLERLPPRIFCDMKLQYIDLNDTRVENLNDVCFPKTMKTVIPVPEALSTTETATNFPTEFAVRDKHVYINITIFLAVFFLLLGWLCYKVCHTTGKEEQAEATIVFI